MTEAAATIPRQTEVINIPTQLEIIKTGTLDEGSIGQCREAIYMKCYKICIKMNEESLLQEARLLTKFGDHKHICLPHMQLKKSQIVSVLP